MERKNNRTCSNCLHGFTKFYFVDGWRTYCPFRRKDIKTPFKIHTWKCFHDKDKPLFNEVDLKTTQEFFDKLMYDSENTF